MNTLPLPQWTRLLFLLSLFCGYASAQGSQLCSSPNGVTVNPTQINFPGTSGPSSFGVSAVPTCTWTVKSNLPYVHIVSITDPSGQNPGGIGSGIVNISIDANPDLIQRGTTNNAITVTPHDGFFATVGILQARNPGDFSIGVSPSLFNLSPGGSGEFNVTYNRSGGFTGNIFPTVSNLPNGMSFNLRNNGTLLDISTNANVICPGNYTLTFFGVNGDQTRFAQPQPQVNVNGDFSLSVSPSSLSVVQGLSSPSPPTVSINRQNGYFNNVTLSASGLPNGASVSFSPNNTGTSSSTIAISTSLATPTGTFPITVSASGGCLTRSATFNLSVSPSWWPAIQEILD